MRADDAEGIVAVLNPIIEAGCYTILDTRVTVDAERRFISGCSPAGIFLVAVDPADGTIVGFQNAQPIAAYTHALDHVADIGTYVDLRRRREGIATSLFTATFARARKKGYEKLFTFVRSDNPAALQTYVRNGFEIVGTARRHAKVGGKYIDEIVIEKFLQID